MMAWLRRLRVQYYLWKGYDTAREQIEAEERALARRHIQFYVELCAHLPKTRLLHIGKWLALNVIAISGTSAHHGLSLAQSIVSKPKNGELDAIGVLNPYAIQPGQEKPQ